MSNTLPPKIDIHLDLSPENAKDQGYIWHSDKIYIPDAPDEANEDIHQWLKDGGVIGLAANPGFNDYAVGLYEPIDVAISEKSQPNNSL